MLSGAVEGRLQRFNGLALDDRAVAVNRLVSFSRRVHLL